jgi:hypothetical protein
LEIEVLELIIHSDPYGPPHLIVTSCIQPADFSKRIPFPSSGVEAAAAVFQVYVETEVRGILGIIVSH